MSMINYASREINCKIVYYGPGLCGKTTNLQHIYDKSNIGTKGKLISLAMSEPDAGSAATDLKTSATPDGDGWLIKGSKVFSTHSPDARISRDPARGNGASGSSRTTRS